MRIVKETKAKPECIAHTMSQFIAFLEHVSRVSHQYQALNEIKESKAARWNTFSQKFRFHF